MEIYHRVIVNNNDFLSAKQWLKEHNIAYYVDEFNSDDNNWWWQFIFKENEYSDLTCACEFAKVYSVHKEVRTYAEGPVKICSVA